VPELPDIEVYVDHLNRRIRSQSLLGVRLASPFLLRSFDPPLRECAGRVVGGVRRMGKRIVVDLDGDLHLVLHLMIAGRLRWRPPAAKLPGKIGLAAFDFEAGALVLTEASPKKRASLHVVRGEEGVHALDRGGLEPLSASIEEFAWAVRRESHTLKLALTDPRLFSGIGNAYSDEILWRARLSPVRLTRALSDEDVIRLRDATQSTLLEWVQRLTRETGDVFPEGVTAFREGMAVHGRYKQPCPACGTPIQRVAHASNEADYCVRCQTGGRLLADRALSRLLRGDWPKTIEELEERKQLGQEKMRRPGIGDAKK